MLAPGKEAYAQGVAATPERLTRRAGFLMHKAGQRGMQLFNAQLKQLGIEVRHYGVLSVLMEEPCSQVALSEALRIDRSSLVELIDYLESKELVHRTAHPDDRRAHLVKVTKRGRKLVLAGDDCAEEADAEFLKPLTASERDQLLTLLVRLA